MSRLLVTVLAVMTAAGATRSFEIASVKINKLGSLGGEGRTNEKIEHSPISLTMTNVTRTSEVAFGGTGKPAEFRRPTSRRSS